MMRSFVAPLGCILITTLFIVSQIHLATVACTNTTQYIHQSLDTGKRDWVRFESPNVLRYLDTYLLPFIRKSQLHAPGQELHLDHSTGIQHIGYQLLIQIARLEKRI